ncbi:methyltransferase [Nonomuraea sp. NPDC050310]|uniref:methyltransferase n=1 Tax=Nonomuraea sp. NPDC050310 TaxID=3154935 RepID=UPI0033FCF317
MPDEILAIATGYMAAKQLFSASRAGLFAALAEGPATAAELAGRTGLPERSARVLADAMNSLGLLERQDGRYRNAPAAERHLAGGQDVDLRPFLAFLEDISYPHWLGYHDSMTTAEPVPLDLGGGRMDTFMTGVMTYNALHARALAACYDFTRHRRLLDYGGLSGAFLIEALRAAPGLSGAFVTTFPHVGKSLAEAGMEGRAAVVEGDVPAGPVPGGFDLVLLEHVVHRYTPADNRAILRRAREAATPDARLLVLDFFLDDEPRQRALDALHAGEYLVIDGTTVYPLAEVREWVGEAGWRPVELLALPGCPRVLVAEAR